MKYIVTLHRITTEEVTVTVNARSRDEAVRKGLELGEIIADSRVSLGTEVVAQSVEEAKRQAIA